MSNESKSELIVEASTRVFPKLGYHRTTVEDILREAGVARSTFYAYFPNKRELFTHVVTDIVTRMVDDVRVSVDGIMEQFARTGSVPDEPEVEEALEQLMAAVFHYMDENRGMTRVFLHELVGIDDEMTALFHRFQSDVTDQFARLIHFGVGVGLLRDVNEQRAADFIVGGLYHLARNLSAEVGEFDIEAVSRDFVELQMRGLASSNGEPHSHEARSR